VSELSDAQDIIADCDRLIGIELPHVSFLALSNQAAAHALIDIAQSLRHMIGDYS
jgi:hypothetical protein